MTGLRTPAQWEQDKERAETDPAKRLRNAFIPEHLRELTWDDYRAGCRAASGEELKDILTDWADHYEPGVREGFTLLGPAGWGKTTGMCLVARQLALAGVYVRYTTNANLIQRRKQLIGLEQQAQRTDDWADANAAAWRLAFFETECDVLFLDDVGKEYRAASGWSDDGLDLLLRRRSEAGKVTCMSSNMAHEDWKSYNDSMASFLYELGEIVELTDGKDWRQRMPAAVRRRRGGR